MTIDTHFDQNTADTLFLFKTAFIFLGVLLKL